MKNSNLALLIRATSLAAEKRRDQRRKGVSASPFVNHPIAVANVLANEGNVHDITILCAALLHDTIEDTDTTDAELVAEFGAEIAAIVGEVTDDKSLEKYERKRLQIEHAKTLSSKAKLVKLADKICNLRDILESPPNWDINRRREYFEWAGAVVAGLRGVHPGLESTFDSLRNRVGELG